MEVTRTILAWVEGGWFGAYGAKASANLYSLVETAKANGLNPYDYLKVVFKELPNAQSIEAIENLLPWNASSNSESV